MGIFDLTGGLVLFLLGLRLMTEGLRLAAGDRIRAWLERSTRHSLTAVGLGTGLGFVAHSSAASVMAVGFINAGLLTLAAAFPVMMGANLGTTLSMQLISIRLTDYALVAVAVGGLIHLVWRSGVIKSAGQALLGFGLIFLGMKLMGDAVTPYREVVAPILARIDGTTFVGMLGGMALATLVTAAVQSSGAVIGIVFVLIGAGAIGRIEQVVPIVLGAHIGTCITALLASMGAGMEARRGALANLGFNVGTSVLAAVASVSLVTAVEWTSDDLIRQTANFHTLVMLVGVAVHLPLRVPLLALLRRVTPTAKPERPPSYLDQGFLKTPEDALAATLRELARATTILRESLQTVEAMCVEPTRVHRQRVRLNEAAIDEIKISVQNYLRELSRGYLSQRQALMVQALNRSMVELERIGDHLDTLGLLELRQRKDVPDGLDRETRSKQDELLAMVRSMLSELETSFDPDLPGYDEVTWRVLERRKDFMRLAGPIKASVNERVVHHELAPMVGLLFSEFSAGLERIGRHCAVVAGEMRQPFFRLKRSKLGLPAGTKEESHREESPEGD